MQQTKNTPEIVIPASPIETDLTCVDCTYNLRGLLHDGSCPECGASIERSVHGDQLVHANPIWLKKVSNGMKWIITALFLAHLPLLTIFTPESLDAKAAFVAVLANQCIAGALLCFGTFMFTAREPRLAHNEDPVNLRKTVRLFSIITGIAIFGTVLPSYSQVMSRNADLPPWIRAVVVTSWFSAPLLFFTGFAYLGTFAKRIPDQSLAKSTRIVMWVPPICIAVIFFATILMMSSHGALEQPFSTMIVVASLILLATLLYAFILLNIYWSSFERIRNASKWTRKREYKNG